MIKIFNMSVLDALKKIPDESIDMQITSPPYWGLRDYGEGTEVIWDGDENCQHEFEIKERKNPMDRGGKGQHDSTGIVGKMGNLTQTKVKQGFCQKCGAWFGQLGLECTIELYISHLIQIFREVKRVLKKEGTCWINMGDVYGGSLQGYGVKDPNYKATGFQDVRKQTYYPGSREKPVSAKIKPKCLLMIPERFAFAMIEDGWILRNKIIWHKPNHMPSSVKDRFTTSWEYLFFFSKSKRYYFDLDAIREEIKYPEDVQRRIEQDYIEGINPFKKGTPESRHRLPGIVRNRICGYKGKYAVENHETFNSPRARNLRKTDLRNYNGRWGNDGKGMAMPEKWNNPLGKNPGDVIQLSPKYEKGEGHSNRQGLNRPLDEITIKAYKEYQEPIALYLKKWIKPHHHQILDDTFGEHRWKHFIRTDLSGASLPSIGDWFKLKEILNFDNSFDNKIYEITKLNIPVFQSGQSINDTWENNPEDFFKITTKPFPEAHFAIFPPKLIEKPIKTTPKWICKKCGKSRKRIIETEGQDIGNRPYETRMLANHITKGWSNCGCGEDWKNAVILDIFAGSGTTMQVARELGRDSIGIEIKKEYIDIIKKRLYRGNKSLFDEIEIII